MKLSTCSLAIVIAVIVVAAAGCDDRPPAGIEAERERLAQREESFLAALSERDAGRAAEFFSAEAIVHIGNMPPIQGRGAIEQLYENVFQYLGAAEYAPELLRLSGSADLAYSAGGVTTFFDTDQGRTEYPGKYVLIWERTDGQWTIALYGISNNRSGP